MPFWPEVRMCSCLSIRRFCCALMKRHINQAGPLLQQESRQTISGKIDKSRMGEHGQPEALLLSSDSGIEARCSKRIVSPAATEGGAEVTQKYKNARSNEYAASSDFCHIYVEQMNSLYLLSLLLTTHPTISNLSFPSAF